MSLQKPKGEGPTEEGGGYGGYLLGVPFAGAHFNATLEVRDKPNDTGGCDTNIEDSGHS